jgi:hypothetical protein
MDLISVQALRALPPHLHYGCACRTWAALMAWFTPIEKDRLRDYGYHPVAITIDVVIAESRWQMVVGRERAFDAGATRLSWK